MTSSSRSRFIDNLDWLATALVFAASLVLYLRTLAPDLLLGDGAEFQVLGYTLGLAHPTGYPVYLLLVRLVMLLPVGDIAYRANLASALFGSLTLALVYLLGRLLGGRRLAALVGPLALALTPLFWWHAIMAEVYTPATAFIALVLFLAVLGRRSGNHGYFFWSGLVGGLGLGVHGMVPLIAPAVVVYLLLSGLNIRPWKLSLSPWRWWLAIGLRAGGGALLGLLLWLGAFWALDLNHPPSNNLTVSVRYNLDVWGIRPQDFDSSFWVRFRYLASGRMFQEVMFNSPDYQVIRQREEYRQSLEDAFPLSRDPKYPYFLWLAGAGLVGLLVYPNSQGWQEGRLSPPLWREGLLLLLSWLVMVYFVINYQIYDIWAFYIPTYVPLAILASVGLACLIDLATRLLALFPPWRARRWLSAGFSALAALALAALAVWPYWSDLQSSWRLRHITFLNKDEYLYYPYPVGDPGWPRSYARSIAAAIEDNAMIFTDWGPIYTILYVTHIEQGRTGINAYEVYSSLSDIEPSAMTLDYIRQNLGKRPIYVTQQYTNMRSRFTFARVGGMDLFRVTGTK